MKNTIINSQIVTFNPKGNIIASNAENFQTKLHEQITRENYSIFLVDMSEVGFLDSAGLMTIVKAFKLVQKMGKRFVICSITAPTSIIFDLIRLDELIEIYQNYREFEDSLLTLV